MSYDHRHLAADLEKDMNSLEKNVPVVALFYFFIKEKDENIY
jgi:hypothetical protein